MIIDSHAHLTDERLYPDADAIVARAREAGVGAIVTIATDAEDAGRAVELAERHPCVFATAGVHPHAAGAADEASFARIEELARHPKVVALGETGLDYFYDNAPRDAQRRSFLRHLEMARSTGLPVVVHAREADEELAAILRERGGGVRGVLHCFASGRELLETALGLGWYASFAGLVTFKKYDGAELIRSVPADRILVETDSPYLAPAPHRGKTNEPALVVHTAHRVAEIRGEDPDAFVARTTANARAFYALPAELD